MAHPLRNLFLHLHRLRGTSVLDRDGVRVRSDPQHAPGAVRSGLFKGTYEDAERALLKACLRPRDTVLEIGGGIGLVGLLAARLAAPGRVVSYEANAVLAPVLEANYALNPHRPELRLKAVTVDGRPAVFHVAENVVSSSLKAREAATREVEVESDAFGAVLAELSPDVLVMDVEGAEIDLLPGADLSGLRAMVLELHPHVVGEAAVEGLMDSLKAQGFRLKTRARLNVLMERA